MVVFKTKVLLFKIENTTINKTQMERESSIECSVSFLWANESFSLWNCLSKNLTGSLTCFEPTKAARILKKLEVHSVLYGQGKYIFKREFLYLQTFYRRFLHFDISVKEKPQNVHLKLIFCHALSRFNLGSRTDPRSSFCYSNCLLGLT